MSNTQTKDRPSQVDDGAHWHSDQEDEDDLLPSANGTTGRPLYKEMNGDASPKSWLGSKGKLPEVHLNGNSPHFVPPLERQKSKSVKVFKRRWAILILFVCYSLSNAFQWIHLNIIYDVLDNFYNASLPSDSYQRQVSIDWLSMIYMLAYIPLIFPATWLLDKKGLRVCGLVGGFLNCLGSWIKCASVAEERFPVLMFAQTICATAQIFILGIPARLAAVWFGPDEVSRATAYGVFGNQVGVAIGFLLPPLIVPNSDNLADIQDNMNIMFYGTASLTTLIFIVMCFVFKKEPPCPPSKAQVMMVEDMENENYLSSLKKLLKNPYFIILTITYGVNTGSYYAIGTLLNPVYLMEHPTDSAGAIAGQLGLTIVVAGIGGSILAGVWLDKTKWYKSTTLGIYILSLVSMLIFTFTLGLPIPWLHFVIAGLLGFFMTGYLPVGFEFAAEITYPSSEGTSSGILNASAQLFGIIFTLSMGALLVRAREGAVDKRAANLIISGALLLGTIATAFIKNDLKRQAAGKDDDDDEDDKENHRRQLTSLSEDNHRVAERLTQC